MENFFPELKDLISNSSKSQNQATEEEEEVAEKVIEQQTISITEESRNPKKNETPEQRNLRRWNKYVARIKEAFAKSQPKNIQEVAVDIFRSCLFWTWAVFSRECYSTSCGTTENARVAASILAIINSKLVDVGKNTILYTLYRIKNGLHHGSKHDVDKGSIFIAECYRQRLVSSQLMVQILIELLEGQRKYVQLVISILWLVSPVLNDDDQDAFRIILSNVYKYQTDPSFSNQINNLYDWRQNDWCRTFKGTSHKYSRIPNIFDLIEEEDQITHDKIDFDEISPDDDNTANFVSPYDLDIADQIHDEYKVFLEKTLDEDEEEEEVHESRPGVQIDLSEMKSTEVSIQESKVKNMELQIRRQVYLTMVSNARADATSHNLIKFENKHDDKYNTIIMTTIIEFVGMEKTFNRDLAVLTQLMCKAKPCNTKIAEELFATNYEQIHTYSLHRITNLAFLYSYLLANDVISWNVLTALVLTEEDTSSAQRVFIRILVEDLAKNMSYDRILRKLRQDDVKVWTSGLFPTDTLDHAEFASAFFTEIKLGFLCEDLNKAIGDMNEEIQRQREEELRLLGPTPQMAWKESAIPEEADIDDQSRNDQDDVEGERVHKHKHRHRHRHDKDEE